MVTLILSVLGVKCRATRPGEILHYPNFLVSLDNRDAGSPFFLLSYVLLFFLF